MDVDKTVKWATGVTVGLVTAIAAWISYTHIVHVTHNQWLPVSVDGMIVTSSLVLLTASRGKLGTIWLARFSLWLGIAATLTANVLYGLPQGVLWAVVSAWPAICFIFSVETVAQLARVKRKKRVVRNTESVPSPRPVKLEQVKSRPAIDAKPAKRASIKIPSIRKIRDELGCGQPIATEVQAIMRKNKIGVQEAYQVRKEGKAHANV